VHIETVYVAARHQKCERTKSEIIVDKFNVIQGLSPEPFARVYRSSKLLDGNNQIEIARVPARDAAKCQLRQGRTFENDRRDAITTQGAVPPRELGGEHHVSSAVRSLSFGPKGINTRLALQEVRHEPQDSKFVG
jgi:hypothetical protein